VARAQGAIGGWCNLDFDAMLDALNEIRHRKTPTPPADSNCGDGRNLPASSWDGGHVQMLRLTL